MDDIPIGGGNKGQFGSEQPDGGAADKKNPDADLPLEGRLVSKTWSIRKEAFETLKGLFRKEKYACKNQLFTEHACSFAKYLDETHPGALESALECFQAFVDRCQPALLGQYQKDYFKPIVDKGLGAAKPNVKAKAMECVIMIFEVSEQFDEETMDVIATLCKSDKLKIQTAAVSMLAALISGYGVKRFSPKIFLKPIEATAGSNNPGARQEAINCFKSIYFWMGDATDSMMSALKDLQKEQLKKDFEELKKLPKGQNKKLTRTEKEAAKDAELNAVIAAEESKEAEVIDVFDISAPVDILSKFNPDWIAAAEPLKKWNERVDKLKEIQTASDVPKLAPGSYVGLFEFLKKECNNSNVNVSQQGIKTVGILAKGLRQHFATHAKEIVPVILPKFKERKLIDDLQIALTNIMMCIQLNEIIEFLDIIEKEKSPQVKINICKFLEDTVLTTYIDDLQDIANVFLPICMKITEEKDQSARDQGLRLVGVLLGRMGEQAMEKYLNGMIPQKKSKVDEAKETVKPSKYDKSKRKEEAAKKKAEADKKAQMLAEKKKPPAKKAVAEDDGEEGLEEIKAPVKKPVAKKPAAKAEASGEAPEKKGPPALSSSKPAASGGGSSGPGKPMTAEMVVEDDIGPGMSKETAMAKAEEFYKPETLSLLADDNKWNQKVEGFQAMQKQIEEERPESALVEATARFIKAKMKDWKESNIQMQKEAVNTLQSCCNNCDDIPKRAFFVFAPFVCDKIGDLKLAAIIKDLMAKIAEFVTAKFVASQVMKNGLNTKAPNNIKESCTILAVLIDEFGAASVHLKNVIDFSSHSANHANKAVRDAALLLFATLYKHMGESIRPFLNNIKDSTLKLVEEEFSKVTVLPRGQFKGRAVKGEAAAEMAAGGGAASLDDILPREDISKHINAKLLKFFDPAGKDWKVKVKGCEMVEQILKDAKMRIKPDGLGDLMDLLQKGMKESNKAVLKTFFALLGTLAEACGEPIAIYRKKCFVPMLQHLSDKQGLVRQQVIVPMNKWAEAIGDHKIIDSLAPYLTEGNPELREEALTWILAHKAALKKVEHKELVAPLVQCLLDKTSKIRANAEEIIIEVMGYIGFQTFMNGTLDLKPAVKQTVTPILQKAKEKCASSNNAGADVEMNEEPIAKAVPKQMTAQQKMNSSRGGAIELKKKEEVQPKIQTSPSKTNLNISSKPSAIKPAPSTSKKAKPDEDEINVNPGSKEKRAQQDAKSKWMHEELKPDQVERVKVTCEQIFGFEYTKVMFSQDFNKHVKVTKSIVGMIDTQPEVLMEILDVFFKWCYIKLTESQNTTLYVSVFDCFQALFDWLIASKYELWEHEAYVLVPLLCEKSGVNNAILKTKVKQLIKLTFQLYDSKKNLAFIIKFGLGGKNLKSVAESLDEVAFFVSNNGIDFLKEADMKLCAKLADSGDKGVREGALQVLGEVYKVLDEDIWRLIGQVTVKVKGLLDGRFKSVKGPNQAPATSRATQNMNSSLGGKSIVQDNNQPGKPSGLMFQKGLSSQKSQVVIQPSNNMGKSINNQISANKLNSSISSQNKIKQSPTMQVPSMTDRNTERIKSRISPTNKFIAPPRDVMNIPMFDEDDEDLRQQINQLDAQQAREQLDPQTKAQVDEIMKHVQNLKYSELAKRVESLIVINEIIQSVQKHQEGIKHTANELIGAFTHVLIDIFERPMSDFPLRFAKYFVTIVNKAASCKEIMREVSEKVIYDLAEQLLTRLLIENLDKVGENKEGEFILKNLNASMLRLLENCNHTHIFCVLFNLLRKYKEYRLLPKLPGLIIKCLLKLSKLLEKLIGRLDQERILLVIHEYLIIIDHDNKSANDEMGIRIVKTLVNELVKVKGKQVWDAYKIIEQHETKDRHIHRWIKIILNCQEKEGSQANNMDGADVIDRIENMDPAERQAEIDKELADIFLELKSTDKFEAAIPKLNNCLMANPDTIDLKAKMSHLSAHFQNFILTHLHAYQKSLAETGSTPQHSKVKVDNWTGQAATVTNQDFAYRSTYTANMEADDQSHAIGRHRSPIPTQPQDQPSESASSFSGTKSFSSRLSSSNLAQPNRFKPSAGSQIQAQSISSVHSANRTQVQPQSTNIGGGSGGGTGGIQKNDEGQLGSSTDRISQYQNKLSSMREKFQQRKSVGSESQLNNKLTQPSQQQPPSQIAKHQSQVVGKPQNGNLGSSFSAMNNSLSKKWNEFKSAKIAEPVANQKDMSSTMIVGPSGSLLGNGRATQVINPQPAMSGSIGGAGNPSVAGASNQDLKSRLDEMKLRLQAMKKN